jgi:hypothetical protein
VSESYREKLRSISFGSVDRREKKKVVKDELGNVTTEHWNDRVDVTINAPRLKVSTRTQEERG